MLIAEDVLLLLLDEVTGEIDGRQDADLVMAGAVLTELALTGRVWLGPSSFLTGPLVQVMPSDDSGDWLLDGAYAILAQRRLGAVRAIPRLAQDQPQLTAGRLVHRGLVTSKRERILGMFPTTRWPARDVRHRRQAAAYLTQVVAGAVPPDSRSTAVLGLLAVSGQVHRIVNAPGLSKGQLRRRAFEVSQQFSSPTTEAAAHAIDQTRAAIKASHNS